MKWINFISWSFPITLIVTVNTSAPVSSVWKFMFMRVVSLLTVVDLVLVGAVALASFFEVFVVFLCYGRTADTRDDGCAAALAGPKVTAQKLVRTPTFWFSVAWLWTASGNANGHAFGEAEAALL